MNPTIVAALISAATALAIALFPLWLKRHQASKRMRRFRGVWTGRGIQNTDHNNSAREYHVRLEVDSESKSILTLERHDADFNFANHLACNALVMDGEFLLLHYRNVREEARQFGSVLLRLSGDGRTLSGVLVGYGIKSEEAVAGTMVLVRA
jgi:hypothetical protein